MRPSVNYRVPDGQPARGGTVSVALAQSTSAIGSSMVFIGGGTGRLGRRSGNGGRGGAVTTDGVGVWPGWGAAVGRRATETGRGGGPVALARPIVETCGDRG